ncbi:hypothetical protein DMN77_23180 [Paenibacillus sp. 79R4]|uniref:hypothetical protein n=1 Tax=Paenibacillus sp. 79R4 TaxID=2212847 RepID=UPI0015B8D36D|nr:hypothetical protein [Paenibacillus sp. 79R4]NWL90458.1 hypothetical protein [Paenibacillus sp. 79R4]
MPIELIESIVEKRSDDIISQAEIACSETLDELIGIIQDLKMKLPNSMAPILINLEDAYLKVCIESSRASYKTGLLDGMKIHNYCNK